MTARLLMVAGLVLLTGCAGGDQHNRLPDHCVKAHDVLVHHSGASSDVVTLCDEYDSGS